MIKKLVNKIMGKEVCSTCGEERTLKDAKDGETVIIDCLKGDTGDCQRLRELGFCESARVHKLADSGALICKVCDTKVIISEELAKKIIVKDNCPDYQEE